MTAVAAAQKASVSQQRNNTSDWSEAQREAGRSPRGNKLGRFSGWNARSVVEIIGAVKQLVWHFHFHWVERFSVAFRVYFSEGARLRGWNAEPEKCWGTRWGFNQTALRSCHFRGVTQTKTGHYSWNPNRDSCWIRWFKIMMEGSVTYRLYSVSFCAHPFCVPYKVLDGIKDCWSRSSSALYRMHQVCE